jgi:heme-degrading monooxygenase HmoA
MYLAMNRFTVPLENAAEFEELWLSRESRLQDMDGFVSFHMLKGSEEDGRVLYASHTVWDSEEKFRAWTTSEEFRASHARAGQTRKLHEGVPRFEGFQSIQAIDALQPA